MLRRLGALLTALALGANLAVFTGPAAAAVGDITTYVVPGFATPTGITTGSDGNVWFTDFSDDRIGRIDPDDGAITMFSDPADNLEGPADITTGSDGNLWFTNRANDRLGRIDPDDGTIVTFADPEIDQNPVISDGITGGPAGDVWFSSPGNGRVGRIEVVDDPPVAVDDAYAKSGVSLTVAAPGVLTNDTDPDSTTLTAALVSGPTHGSVTLQADGSFTYTSSSALGGTDSFTYTASDGVSASSPATVTITTTTPASKDACNGGGWTRLTDENGQPFKNQGRCMNLSLIHI